MRETFRVRLIYFIPILASLLFGVLCAHLLIASSMVFPDVTPFPDTPIGSIGNAFYFVVLVAVGATFLLLLLRLKSYRLILIFTGFALTAVSFMLSTLYLSAVLLLLDIPSFEASLFGSTLISCLVCYAVFRERSKVLNFIVVFLGGATGAFLGWVIPTLSAILILCFMAAYDIFTVHYGPVGKIAREGIERFSGLVLSLEDFQMGLGDLTFYSMLSCHMLSNIGTFPCIASIIGILAGCLLSFKTLEKRGIFPGLPFPVSLGLLFGFLVSLI